MYREFGSPAHSSPSEPMALGSPSGSSSSPGSSQYIPSYLTGDTPIGISPVPTRLFRSPTKQNVSQSGMTPLSSSNLSQNQSNLAQIQRSSRSFIGRQSRDKPGGPPVQSLFQTVSPPPQQNQSFATAENYSFDKSRVERSALLSPEAGSMNGILSPLGGLNQTNRSLMSPAQIDPFYTQGENLTVADHLDETWVTVFGFYPAAAGYILQQFSQYGTILEHKKCPSGNWMHIHYQSKLQAKKALSKNGKIYGGNMMIAVKPCVEKTIIDDCNKENSLFTSSSIIRDNMSESGLNESMKLGSIRPLTQAYKTVAIEHQVTPHGRTPQRSSGLISKAMDYIFNW